jgi:hypothetical protein
MTNEERYRKGLEDILRHMDILLGPCAVQSAVYQIASKALHPEDPMRAWGANEI